MVPSPNVEEDDNNIYALAVVTGDDVWAVGEHHGSTVVETLVEHWDGDTWSVFPNPNVGNSRQNFLYGVTAVSATDVWAVGYYLRENISRYRTLIEHWEGSAWSVVPSPYPAYLHPYSHVHTLAQPHTCHDNCHGHSYPHSYIYLYTHACHPDARRSIGQ